MTRFSEKTEIGALSGWGIAPESLARFFPAGTVILPPTRENAQRLLGSASRVFGYSLGAWFLLDEAGSCEKICAEKVALCAPFLAFPRELGKGGKISATQVKFLRRWMKKDPLAAIADFYRRAGLSFPVPNEIPYRIEDLDTGLEALVSGDVSAVPASAESWEIVLGAEDALLDAKRVAETFPRNRVKIVAAGTHDFSTLIQEL